MAASGPTRRTSTLTGCRPAPRPRRSAGRGAAFTRSCRSMITMWPAPSHSTRTESGSFECSLRLWPIEVSLSSVPQMTVVGTACSALDRVELVEARRRPGRTPRPPRTASPTASRRRSRRSSPAPRRRRRTGRWPPTRRTGPPGAGRRRGGARAPASPRASSPAGHRCAWAAAAARSRCGSRPPAVVEIRPTPTTRLAEQLRVLLGQGDDRHAAHGVADEDDRTLGDDLVEDPPRGRGRAGRRWPCPRSDRPERPCERWS